MESQKLATVKKQLEPLLYRYEGLTDFANVLFGAVQEERGNYAEAHLLLWELLGETTEKLREVLKLLRETKQE